MPSSLIIVGLAAAWLAVLVPMVARKRQVITQTNDAALAARVVRSGNAGGGVRTPALRRGMRRDPDAEEGEFDDEFADDGFADAEFADDGFDEDFGDGRWSEAGPWSEEDEYGRGAWDGDEFADDVGEYDTHGYMIGTHGDDYRDEDGVRDDYARDAYVDDGTAQERAAGADGRSAGRSAAPGTEAQRRYRPGRGGFNPEAAELAAKEKYAFRQRIVVLLLLTAVATGATAALALPPLWWAHAIVDAVLVGYLMYLRRQVRIEEEIRQRRLARMRAGTRRAPRRPDPLAGIEVVNTDRRDVVGCERKPMPTSRVRRQAVVVDREDEDPAFHELANPGQLPYRRAVGE